MNDIATDGNQYFNRGFPVGFKTGAGKDVKHFLNNHVRIIVQYHDDKDFELLGLDEVYIYIYFYFISIFLLK